MPNYRRVKIKGGTYFLTLVTYQRQEIFSSEFARKEFLKAIQHVQTFHPFLMIAYCILPDHIHLILKLPENDDNFSMRIAEIKKRFSKNYFIKLNCPKKVLSYPKGQNKIWQNRFWEHFIRDQNDLYQHIDYIHYNPVKHEFVSHAKDWSSSSFRQFVEEGFYDINWGQGCLKETSQQLFGE
jgi:putative transposase